MPPTTTTATTGSHFLSVSQIDKLHSRAARSRAKSDEKRRRAELRPSKPRKQKHDKWIARAVELPKRSRAERRAAEFADALGKVVLLVWRRTANEVETNEQTAVERMHPVVLRTVDALSASVLRCDRLTASRVTARLSRLDHTRAHRNDPEYAGGHTSAAVARFFSLRHTPLLSALVDRNARHASPPLPPPPEDAPRVRSGSGYTSKAAPRAAAPPEDAPAPGAVRHGASSSGLYASLIGYLTMDVGELFCHASSVAIAACDTEGKGQSLDGYIDDPDLATRCTEVQDLTAQLPPLVALAKVRTLVTVGWGRPSWELEQALRWVELLLKAETAAAPPEPEKKPAAASMASMFGAPKKKKPALGLGMFGGGASAPPPEPEKKPAPAAASMASMFGAPKKKKPALGLGMFGGGAPAPAATRSVADLLLRYPILAWGVLSTQRGLRRQFMGDEFWRRAAVRRRALRQPCRAVTPADLLDAAADEKSSTLRAAFDYRRWGKTEEEILEMVRKDKEKEAAFLEERKAKEKAKKNGEVYVGKVAPEKKTEAPPPATKGPSLMKRKLRGASRLLMLGARLSSLGELRSLSLQLAETLKPLSSVDSENTAWRISTLAILDDVSALVRTPPPPHSFNKATAAALRRATPAGAGGGGAATTEQLYDIRKTTDDLPQSVVGGFTRRNIESAPNVYARAPLPPSPRAPRGADDDIGVVSREVISAWRQLDDSRRAVFDAAAEADARRHTAAAACHGLGLDGGGAPPPPPPSSAFLLFQHATFSANAYGEDDEGVVVPPLDEAAVDSAGETGYGAMTVPPSSVAISVVTVPEGVAPFEAAVDSAGEAEYRAMASADRRRCGADAECRRARAAAGVPPPAWAAPPRPRSAAEHYYRVQQERLEGPTVVHSAVSVRDRRGAAGAERTAAARWLRAAGKRAEHVAAVALRGQDAERLAKASGVLCAAMGSKQFADFVCTVGGDNDTATGSRKARAAFERTYEGPRSAVEEGDYHNWKIMRDGARGAPFFKNMRTGRARWELPEELRETAEAAARAPGKWYRFW